MSLLSKTKVLVDAIYNDFNRLFDQDEMALAPIPTFHMDNITAIKVQMMEHTLNGKSDSTPMGGAIYVNNNGKFEAISVHTVGEARAVIDRIKSGELRYAA